MSQETRPVLQAQVEQLHREARADLARHDVSLYSAMRPTTVVPAVLLATVGSLLLLLALGLAAGARDVAAAVVVAVPALALLVPGVLLWRRAWVRDYVPARRERETVVHRLAELEAVLAGEQATLDGRPVELRTPVRRSDRPRPYVRTVWNRLPWLGPPPDEELVRLGPDGPPLLRWFHREVGWGLALFAGLAVVVVLLLATW